MIGTDFEEFVHDGYKIASAIGLIGGDKEDPVWCEGGNMQEDNVLAEGATNPASSFQEFWENIQSVRKSILSTIPEGFTLVTEPWHEYQREFLLTAGSNALRFGCSEEVQAWTGEIMESPSPYTELRTAGAHVHFSYDNPTAAQTLDIIKMLDFTLGIWSLTEDSDTRRRELYGKAGSCRIKEYGGEYRALSNFWIRTREYAQEVYERTEWCVQNRHRVGEFLAICPGDTVREVIDGYRITDAERIHREVQSIMRSSNATS